MIDEKELRGIIEGRIYSGDLKNKSRRDQAKKLGVDFRELSRYLNHNTVSLEVKKKMAGANAETLDDEQHKKAAGSWNSRKPKLNKAAGAGKTNKSDAEVTERRRAIEDYQERKELEEYFGIQLSI